MNNKKALKLITYICWTITVQFILGCIFPEYVYAILVAGQCTQLFIYYKLYKIKTI